MKKELLELEQANIFEDVPLLDFIYVITTRSKHDSGYMCMEIIGENKDGYKKKLATYSDVVELDKIFTKNDWVLSMDCPEYNVIRLFSNVGKFKVIHHGISSFVIELRGDGSNGR